MIRLLTFPVRLFSFWLLFFAVFRLWFVLWFRHEWSETAPNAVWASFWYALPLDLSMAAYLVAIPVLVWFVGWGFNTGVQQKCSTLIFWFNALLFGGLVFPFGANIFLYEEWHTLLNNRALEYFKDPSALLDSMSFGFKVASVLLYVGFVWLVSRVYLRVVGRTLYPEKTPRLGLLAFPAWVCLLPLAIRGGLGVMPINESAVYYSVHLFDNHAATNTAWHMVHSLIESRSTKNHYEYQTKERAQDQVDLLFGRNIALEDIKFDFFKDSTTLNVVFIIMESMTAQVVEELGGEKGVCPILSRLIREGILFTNCYSSGYRTDQGLVAVLAGYPAQPDQSIVLLEDKASKLSSMSKILKKDGYSTAFFYGGELTFANIGAWLTQQRFEHIFSEKDFDSAEKTQRWGVDDRILLQRSIQEVGKLPQPFFATAMTLSLHPPFDVPFQSRWQGNSEREKFLNSAAFADDAIGDFFKRAEQQPWYNNTLFVLVADHGASPPQGVGLDNPVSRQVPWIIFGKPLNENWHGRKIDLFCNHHDIPATVLGMIGKHHHYSELPWSRNQWMWDAIINSYKTEQTKAYHNGFAYFSNENGMGWLNDQGKSFFYFEKTFWHDWQGALDTTSRQQAQGYLQTLYDDFLAK
jgi:phosphoglycerol transferase MdoB-like AlkP superfamily enzyme